MKHIVFAIPGDIDTPTGGYIYDRRIADGLRKLGWQVEIVGLGDGFPFPSAQTLRSAQQLLAAVPIHCPILIDGLAFGVMPEIAARLALTHQLIALVHHPLALESGLSTATADMFRKAETQALSHASHVIVTSPATARTLISEFLIPPAQLSVVMPGTDRVATVQSAMRGEKRGDSCLRLLSVGSIVPRKGFNVLMQALATLKDLPWTLTIAGDRSRDAQASLELDADLERFALDHRVKILGAVSPAVLESLYQSADLFVLASHYEGYGMAFAEALAHGLPIIATTGGAIPETVPLTAGLLVEPGRVDQFAEALRRVMTDAQLHARLSAGALRAAGVQPDWQQSAQLFSEVLDSVRG